MVKYNPESFESESINFLRAWPESRIKTMTIEDYADLQNPDSLCYWLEYGTKHLGEIGAVALHKFELWKPKNKSDFKNDKFIKDLKYAWNSQKGETSRIIFPKIVNLILEIIKESKNQNWEAIDKIPFHAIGKWKIAFLYSDKKLLPVYSKRALMAISQGLGKIFKYKIDISVFQRFILEHKTEESLYEFYYRLYTQFALKPSDPKYYIIGSKYGNEEGKDVIPKIHEFIENQCVAIGFLDWVDFSEYIGADKETTNEFIKLNWSESKPSLYKMQRYFRLLSQIKPGDIIAVKSHGAYNSLTIIAYAEVVERNGSIYEYNPETLGHQIYVEFLEIGLNKETGLNYAETIHNIKPKDKNFKLIFGWYGSQYISQINTNNIENLPKETNHNEENHYNEKPEGSYERGPIATTTVRLIHNSIQNRFIEYLKTNFIGHKIEGEKTWIDAKRETEDAVFIYEIKPYTSVYFCVRQGIGQLLDYSHQNKTQKKKYILIVGQNKPETDDLQFIKSIRDNLNIPFSYLAFDDINLRVEEY